MKGIQFSLELNEFVASALLIAVAAIAVGYWQTHRPAEVIKEATVKVETIPAPPAKVTVRVVYPKPKPQTDMYIQPAPQDQLNLPQPQAEPKRVWDNDNLLRASDPPTFVHRTPQITAALKDSQ
jgi:hypothetical protein